MPTLLDYFRPQPRSIDPFGSFNGRVTYYAPGPGDRMEGGFETSRPNPITGKSVPATLDNYRLGYSPFVTLAGDPSRYGQAVNMGPLTYTSPIDQKSYTLPDVTGVVHDTGSAFKGRPDKLDVAAGDYRGWSPQAASAAVQADGGRRTVTPVSMPQRPSGMDMEFDPWTGQAPPGGAVDSPAEGPTAVASGPPQQRQKTMPQSLMDMFQPTDAAGDPTTFDKALAGQRQGLIGFGLGLASPAWQGESQMSNALQGYQRGSAQDATQARYAQAMAHQKTQDARQAAMDKFNIGMKEREFTRGGETDFQKIQADILKYGEPARQFYAAKYGETPQLTKITNPNTGEDETVLFNPRAPKGQQFTPVPTDIFNPPGTTAAPPAAPGTTPAPGTVPGAPAASIDPNAPSATGPTTPKGPADLPPRVGPKAFEPEEKLRKEFNAATKPHQEVRQSYNRLLAAKDTAAGDIALIFGYMRMLDPGSVVREGEFATAQNAAGIPDMVRNMYNRALSGERLNPNQRGQFKDQASSIYEKYDQEYSARADQFRQIAKQNRIDPSRVIPDLGPAPKAAEKTAGDPLAEARDAIKRGAPRAAVIERLAKSGVRFNPKDLD